MPTPASSATSRMPERLPADAIVFFFISVLFVCLDKSSVANYRLETFPETFPDRKS
jgi:hypothetical protein